MYGSAPFPPSLSHFAAMGGLVGGLMGDYQHQNNLDSEKIRNSFLGGSLGEMDTHLFFRTNFVNEKNFNYSKRIKNIRNFYFNPIFIFAKIIF